MNKPIVYVLAIIFSLNTALWGGTQPRVVRTYKIERGKATNDRYWLYSTKMLQKEFNTLLKKNTRIKKMEISPDLIGLQRTTRTRTNNQRKIFHMQLDKIDRILHRMSKPERTKAIKNIQTRIYNLKQRMGGC